MRLHQFVIDGLGHLSTLIADHDAGVAVVVDPRRDVDVYLEAAAGADLRITHVLETHLHNDYVSGGRELAALTGASHVIGGGADLAHEHRPIRHHDRLETGALRITALETPGHTPEHVSYAVADTSRADEPVALLTGGSLLVGAVGRTDLLGAERAVAYAHDQFRSLHEVILPHEDSVAVLPTHGAGSLCSTGISSTPSSTIGYERRHNPMLQPAEADEFARRLLDGQPGIPRYFARMRPLNRAGPPPLGGRPQPPQPLPLAAVRDALAGEARLVDARPAVAHAAGHPPEALSIPAGSSFGTWLGWVVEPDRPIVLLLDDVADWDDVARQAARVGYDRLEGHLQGGFRAWQDAGLPVAATPRLGLDRLAELVSAGGPDAPLVIDVRQPGEYVEGHVPGAVHIAAGDLQDRLAELPRDRTVATICASGYRSSVAASLLARAGFERVAWVPGGVPAWRAAGFPTEGGGPAVPASSDAVDAVAAGSADTR